MAERVVNSVRTENIFLREVCVWIIDPFGSALKQLRPGKSHVTKSPVFQTWWRDEYQVELKFKKVADAVFSLSTTISNLHPRNKVFGSNIGHRYRIVLPKNGTNTLFHDGFEPKSNYKCNEKLEDLETLKLSIEIIIYPMEQYHAQSTPALLSVKDRLAAIGETKGLLDFSIYVAGEEVKVNKAVLSLASPVFLAMFGHDFKETKSQAIHIDDVDIDTVRQFMKFIHTSKPPTFTNVKSVVELLHMADKYEVLDLRKICLEHVYSIFPDKI